MKTTTNHVYIIRNKKTKEIWFQNSNTACFHEWTEKSMKGGPEKRDNIFKFDKNDEIVFFYPVEILQTTEKIKNNIKDTVKEFKKIGCPVDLTEMTFTENIHPYVEQNQLVYAFSLDLGKCKNHQTSVFFLHLCRYLWDGESPRALEVIWDYKKLHKCSFWAAFIISHKIKGRFYTNSHQVIYSYQLYQIPTIKKLKEQIAVLKEKQIQGHKFQYVFNSFLVTTKVVRELINETENIKEYKKLWLKYI